MTVSVQSSQSTFLGNGSATSWTFPWVGVAAADINVYLVSSTGSQTLLSSSVYGITLNAAGAGQLWGVGGTITYPLVGSPIANGTSLIVQRAVPFSQLTSVTNQTAYPLSVQTALDTLCFEIQQIATRTGQIRGTWATGVQYNYGDIVQDGANGGNTLNLYICALPNVSATWSSDLAAGDWTLVFNVQNINQVIGNYLPLAGGNLSGTLNVGGNLSVTGTTALTGNVTMQGTLAVTGNATVPTQASNDNSTKAASTAMVQAAIAASAASPTTTTPQGRLTLASGTPVMTADAVAQTAIYYAPYAGSIIPIYSGSAFVSNMFSQLTLTLNTSNHLSGSLYDVFVFLNSGVVTIATGPAWTNTTTRSAAITQLNGIWVNNAIITLINNATTYSNIAANKATYVGTFYATANGQTGVALRPSAASGGCNNIVGLFNAYNRQRVNARSIDTTASWTYSTSTWRSANNSTSNRVTFVDGLAQIFSDAGYQAGIQPSSNVGFVGVGFNSTTAAIDIAGWESGAVGQSNSGAGPGGQYPTLGLNYWQALEIVNTGTVTFLGQENTIPCMMLSVSTEF